MPRGLLSVLMPLAVAGCALPSSRQNVATTTQLIAGQTRAPLIWRRDDAADKQARAGAEAMLADGLTIDEAVAVAFLASPELQLMLEQLEISRAQLVTAATPPNPVGVVGMRDPGGHLAAFYPQHTISIGVLENVIALLNLPDRRAVAKQELERVRFEVASRVTQYADQVAGAWLEYRTAQITELLRRQAVDAARATLDTSVVHAANGDAASIEVANMRASLANMENSLLRGSLEAASARGRLGQLLGLTGWHDDWQLAGPLPGLPDQDFDSANLETQALQRRLDVQAAAKAVESRLRALATQRRFRWLNQLDLGYFRDKAVGGSAFTGPNAVFEIPLFDQRQGKLLEGDAELRSALRTLELTRMTALTDIRRHAAEMQTARALLVRLGGQDRPAQPQEFPAVASTGADTPDRLRARVAELNVEEQRVLLLRDYWRARSALALSLGDWQTAQIAK